MAAMGVDCDTATLSGISLCACQIQVLWRLTDVVVNHGVQKFASAYAKTVFLKFYGNHSEGTKHLFETRLQTPMTPTFTFWRRGEPAWLLPSLPAYDLIIVGCRIPCPTLS